MTKKSNYDISSALQKVQSFCAYQERCVKDVKDKLIKLGVETSQINPIISDLQKNNFLNEERYAISFTKGKLQHNKWGKVKIHYELINKHIPASIINKAINEIDEDDYLNILKSIISKKLKELKVRLNKKSSESQNIDKIKSQIFRFTQSKGFENDLTNKAIKSFL